MTRQLASILLASCAFAASSGAALAQTAPTSVDELIVTAQTYQELSATSATKTETPILETPQSVQQVTDRLILDARPRSLTEALFSVSGVADGGGRRAFDFPILRGFDASTDVYLDGLRVERGATNFPHEIYGLERIEVLKGPSGVLFGQGGLGGVINQISKRPTPERRGYLEVVGGSYDFVQGRLDVSGALADTVSARLNAIYRSSDDYVDFLGKERVYLAPALAWAPSDQTSVTVLGSYNRDRQDGSYIGLPAEGTVLPNINGDISLRRNVREPGWDTLKIDRWQIGYLAEHRLSDALTLRQNLRYSDSDVLSQLTVALFLAPDQRTLNRGIGRFANTDQTLAIDSQIEARFEAGNVQHTLLGGLDIYDQDVTQSFAFGLQPSLDLFNPIYGRPFGPLFPAGSDFDRRDRLVGVYLQDQMKVGRLNLLVAGRYESDRTKVNDRVSLTRSKQTEDAFVPRVGATYAVSDNAAIYATWARSFAPNIGLSFGGETFKAERGESFEAGVKTLLVGDRLTSTFSVYEIERSNVLTSDPDPSRTGFQIATGKQRSRGFEADMAFRIADGWNLTAAYTRTSIKITEDVDFAGERPINVPRNQASLFTKYEIPSGPLAGLGIGGGIRYVGEREAALPNSYLLPDYLVADATLSYRLERVLVQLNVYNLFDEDYFPSSASTGGIGVLVGQPRSAQLSVGLAF